MKQWLILAFLIAALCVIVSGGAEVPSRTSSFISVDKIGTYSLYKSTGSQNNTSTTESSSSSSESNSWYSQSTASSFERPGMSTSGSSSFDASSLSESCEVVSCLACAANRPTACVRCADGYVLASNGTACLLSGDGGFEAPATGLVALLVTALVVISVGVST